MTTSPSTAPAAFPIERMSFGEGSSRPEPTAPPEPAVAPQEAAAGRVIQQLADDIARALGTALYELDQQRAVEGGVPTQKLASQIEFLMEGLAQVRQKTEQLVATVSEQGVGVRRALEKCEVLAAGQTQQAEAAREAAMASLRQQSDDVTARVAAVVDRLDRHAEALRGFVNSRHRISSALEQVASLLASLREAEPPALPQSL